MVVPWYLIMFTLSFEIVIFLIRLIIIMSTRQQFVCK